MRAAGPGGLAVEKTSLSGLDGVIALAERADQTPIKTGKLFFLFSIHRPLGQQGRIFSFSNGVW